MLQSIFTVTLTNEVYIESSEVNKFPVAWKTSVLRHGGLWLHACLDPAPEFDVFLTDVGARSVARP